MIDQYIMKMCLVLSTFGVNILCQRFLQTTVLDRSSLPFPKR